MTVSQSGDFPLLTGETIDSVSPVERTVQDVAMLDLDAARRIA